MAFLLSNWAAICCSPNQTVTCTDSLCCSACAVMLRPSSLAHMHISKPAGFGRSCRELDTEGGIASWTDFLKAQLHPASVRLLPGLWQGVADFSGFGAASGVLAREDAREDALDRVRLAAEECDRLQVRCTHMRVTVACGGVPPMLREAQRGPVLSPDTVHCVR